MYNIGQIPRDYIFPSISGFLNSPEWKLFTNILIVVFGWVSFRNSVQEVNFYYFSAGQNLGSWIVSCVMIIDYYWEWFGIAPIPQWARYMGTEPGKGKGAQDQVNRQAGKME